MLCWSSYKINEYMKGSLSLVNSAHCIFWYSFCS